MMKNRHFWYFFFFSFSPVTHSMSYWLIVPNASTILMCPISYPSKGLCKGVNCSILNNPITTCLKVGLLFPYSVDGRVTTVRGLISFGFTSSDHSPEISKVVLQHVCVDYLPLSLPTRLCLDNALLFLFQWFVPWWNSTQISLFILSFMIWFVSA